MKYQCEKVGVDFFDSAPTSHRATVDVEASPEQVFGVLLDADAWTKWAFPITGVEWTSGFPIEVGSTRTVDMRGGLIGYEEFIAYEHGSRMAFRFNEATREGIVAFAEDYRVTDLDRGRCYIEWTMAMDTGRDDSGLASKVSGPVMSFMLQRMLNKFGRLVEATPLVEVKS
ncbi:MAG: SRPBCC family protein [Microthrixaceae bacterium]